MRHVDLDIIKNEPQRRKESSSALRLSASAVKCN
jgi:hypothetical protein